MTTEEIWNGWKVENLIGEGSFGKVYKITREDFGRTYVAALKVIEIPTNKSEIKAIKSEGLTDESVTTYFKSMVEDIVDEFSLMAKLKGNTNIVSYEDHMVVPKKKEFGWDIYIRMELLNPLLDHIETQVMTVKDVVQLGIDICNALEVCQRYHIIHRDIKPENIFVSDIGSFKLGDFGIARQLEKTMSGLSKKGTYTYMAPEVYKGMPYNSSVDTYSLGIVMYRFLNNNRSPFMPPITEQIKFSDREEANLRRFSGEKIPKPCKATDKLSEIILKACSYNPEERYRSPAEMKESLQKYLGAEEDRILCMRLIEPQLIEEKSNTPQITESLSSQTGALIEEEPTEFMGGKPEVYNIGFEADERTVLMTEEESKESLQDAITSEEPKAATLFREKEQSKKAEKNKFPKGKAGIAALVVVFAIMLAGALLLVFGKNGTEQAQETTVEYVDVPNIVGRTVSEATELLDSYGLKLDVTEERYSDEIKEGAIISLASESTKVPSGSTVEIILSKGEELIAVPYVSGMKQSKAKAKLKKMGFVVQVKKNYSDIYGKGKVIEQSAGSGVELKKGSTITIVVSKGTDPSENIDNSTYTSPIDYFDEPINTDNSSREITANRNLNSKKEKTTKQVVKKIGNYKESNALPISKIDVLRESLNISGASDNEYMNLARYMANNGMGNAASAYYQLTNAHKSLRQKTYSLSIASSSNEDLLEAAMKITNKISTKKYGVGISSSVATVGYKIYIVVVYS